jgi:hypothetical protein
MIACTAIAAALLIAQPGSTITAAGTCPTPVRLPARDYGGVVLDLRAAELPEGMVGRGVKGLSIRGGTWGRSDIEIAAWHIIQISAAEDLSIAEANFVGNGDARGSGISISASARVTIRDNRFSGLATGFGFNGSTDALAARNRIEASTGDGINVVDSHRVVVRDNQCRAFKPAIGAHPDCIQFRSIAGKPKQSQIWVINNDCVATAQCFFGADYQTHFHGNYAAADRYTHTITGSACIQCEAFDNVLTNHPGSANGPGSLKGMADPSSITGRNLSWDARANGWAPRVRSFVRPPIADQVGSRFDRAAEDPAP